MKKLFILATMLAAVCISGCKKEEEAVDVRDAAVGTYNGTLMFYVLQSNELKTFEGMDSLTINGSVTKDSSSSTSIRIECFEEVFYGSKIGSVSNGFVFDIEEQTADLGSVCTIEGYNAVKVGTSKYNGAFFS